MIHRLRLPLATRRSRHALLTIPAAGIISLGFPRKGDPVRSQHVPNTVAPILFVQGTNDALGSRVEIEEMTRPLGDRASLQRIDGATHGFSVEGRELGHVASEVAVAVRQFSDCM